MAKDPDRDEPRELRQQRIPDPNRKTVPEIEDAAEKYVKLRNRRMSLLEQEVDAAASLLGLMHEHKVKDYTFDGQIVSIAEIEKVKVKKMKEED